MQQVQFRRCHHHFSALVLTKVLCFRGAASLLQVWNKEDPCFICGFDMDPLGAVQALASQPEGTAICCFSLEQPGSLVIACKQKGTDASAEDGGVLQVRVSVASGSVLFLFTGWGGAADGSACARCFQLLASITGSPSVCTYIFWHPMRFLG
jgi:hypothetical protein